MKVFQFKLYFSFSSSAKKNFADFQAQHSSSLRKRLIFIEDKIPIKLLPGLLATSSTSPSDQGCQNAIMCEFLFNYIEYKVRALPEHLIEQKSSFVLN